MHKFLICILMGILCLIGYVVATGQKEIHFRKGVEYVKEEARKPTLAQAYLRVGQKRNSYQNKLIDTYKRSMELADFNPSRGFGEER